MMMILSAVCIVIYTTCGEWDHTMCILKRKFRRTCTSRCLWTPFPSNGAQPGWVSFKLVARHAAVHGLWTKHCPPTEVYHTIQWVWKWTTVNGCGEEGEKEDKMRKRQEEERSGIEKAQKQAVSCCSIIAHTNEWLVRVCNYVKFETGRNLPPVLKIVTCRAHNVSHYALLLSTHVTGCSIFSTVQ